VARNPQQTEPSGVEAKVVSAQTAPACLHGYIRYNLCDGRTVLDDDRI